MANRFRGEFEIKVGERVYTWRYGINTLIALEDRFKVRTIDDLIKRMHPTQISFRDLRAMVHAGLLQHHSDMKEEDAGDLIDDLGGVDGALDRILEAVQASFPDQPQEGGGDPNGNGAGGSGASS